MKKQNKEDKRNRNLKPEALRLRRKLNSLIEQVNEVSSQLEVLLENLDIQESFEEKLCDVEGADKPFSMLEFKKSVGLA